MNSEQLITLGILKQEYPNSIIILFNNQYFLL